MNSSFSEGENFGVSTTLECDLMPFLFDIKNLIILIMQFYDDLAQKLELVQ